MAMRIAVIGKTGQVARALQEGAAARRDLEIVPLGRPELDLARPETIAPAVREAAPDLVVNAAAYNAVDQAEREQGLNRAVNGEAPGLIAEAATKLNIPVIHFSTDYVFDGMKGSAYTEADRPNPLSDYGRAKLEGERTVAVANPRHLVLRTAWVFSPYGGNFVKLMLRLARERDAIQVVTDQTGCPTCALDIAAAVLAIAPKLTGASFDAHGVYHLAGAEAVTRFAFAQRIFSAFAAQGGRLPRIEPVTSAKFPSAAVRPTYSALDSARFGATFGVAMSGLDAALARTLQSIESSPPRST
jgi:dTDP-4-dehydrorhamnose reductase